ncbi:MAG: hypothetical protein RI885_2374 [Actinomycetota bacterium]
MPSDLPFVSADDIVRVVGRAAAGRGQDYARRGAVGDVDWNPDTLVVSARVRGSDPLPYSCSVRLADAGSGRLRPVTGDCDCPVALDCKHAAAILYHCNREHVRALAADSTARVPGRSPLDRQPGAAGAPPGRARAGIPEPVTWRTALSTTTSATNSGQGASGPGAGDLAPLGLLFELRVSTVRRGNRWLAPSTEPAKPPLDPTADYHLAVRPVMRSHTGNWVRSTVSWSSLSYQQQRLPMDSGQARWFAQFAALARSSREMFATHDPDWLSLDDFASPLLWPLLDSAVALGIGLVVGKKGSAVTLARTATLGIEAVVVETDAVPNTKTVVPTAITGSGENPRGPVRLDPVLEIDGVAHPTAGARAIGDHGVYVATFDPQPAIVLAATSGPLTDEQRSLLRRPAVVIPPAEVDEFLSDFYPRLARHVPVRSATLELPAPVRPELVLTAAFEPNHALRLTWWWRYGGEKHPLPPTDQRAADAAGLRDPAAEAALLARAADVLAERPVDATLTGVGAAEFSAQTIPRLQQLESVVVTIVGVRPDYHELTGAPHLTVTASDSSRSDWLDLGVTVTVDGRDVPFAPLFTALSKGRTKLLLIDHSYLSLQHPAFAELKRLIDEASELAEWETTPRITRYHAELWSEFEDLADETVAATSWRETARGLLDAREVERVAVPEGLAADLRPYQRDGFDWLAFLHGHRLGGILADDMGLGKTVQTLALIAHTAETRDDPGADAPVPFLVVAPTSVVPNWVSEAARYTPGLEVRGIAATEKKAGASVAEVARGAHVVVTSYALFRLDAAAYQSVSWAGVVFDEAQFLKNPASKAHRYAVELAAPVKFALTGTPLENSLIDLWALFAIVAPGLFPSKRRFTEEYVVPITKGEDAAHVAARTSTLRRRIRPLMMRRTKELVATELPAKQEQQLRVELAPKHRALYDTHLQRERQKLLGLVADLDRNRFIVFRSLTLLRMLSLDASLIDEGHRGIPSAKLDALLEHLDDVVAEGHRALVFSQFTSFLRLAAERLDDAGIRYEYLDGSTTRRSAVISRFREGTAPVFLISLKAGGFGLNLTEADYVFLLDPWWNPATESQAVDRTHRIGQTRPVNVYRLVATGTIEEKVMALRDRKAELFESVMDDDAVFSAALTEDDIRGLLDF